MVSLYIMNKSNLLKNFIAGILTLSLLGAFAIPAQASADFDLGSILASIGIGNGSTSVSGTYSNSGSYGGYDYNSTSSQHQGDIQMGKVVRDLTRGSGFHENITVRSGSLVEVAIEVKNTSSKYDADVTVTDEIGGSSVYVKNSLIVGGVASTGSLTSGGLRLRIAKKGKITVSYKINVCSGADYPARAYAYAAGIGSATDGAIVKTEQAQYGYSDFTSTCLTSFQQASSNTNSTGTYSTNSNPFGSWTGVNNADNGSFTSTTTATTNSNPFGNWTGVNSNTATTTTSNPFGGWTGVNNATSNSTVNSTATMATTSSNPFGDWSGVNNANSNTNVNQNPFGEWTGVGSNSGSTSTDPFGNWTGVNNFDTNPGSGSSSNGASSNPFGDWSGVNSNGSSYDSSGYQTSTDSNYSATSYESSAVAYDNSGSTAYRVAPTTGVNKFAPVMFAGMLTLAFLAYRKRKLLFN